VTPRRELFAEEIVRAYVDDDPRFVERPWLGELIAEKLRDPDRRFLLVTGEPGSGKTALMAWLAKQHADWPRYYIRRDSQVPLNSGDARSLLFAVGHQLASLHPAQFELGRLEISVRQRMDEVGAGGRATGISLEELAVSPFRPTALRVEQDVGLVGGELEGISVHRLVAEERLLELPNLAELALFTPARALLEDEPDARVVILVDALDELRYHSSGTTALDWLASCPELPPNVRFVLSSRPDDRLLELLRRRQSEWLLEVEMDAEPGRVANDLSSYALGFASEPAVAAALEGEQVAGRDFVQAAVERADGNFQYLAALVRGIDNALDGPQEDVGRLLRLADVPAGLRELYAFFLSLVRDAVGDERVGAGGDRVPAWEGLYQPVLGVLAVAFEPLTVAQVGFFAAIDAGDRWVRGAIGRLSQFLDRTDGRYRLYHASLPEYLTAAETLESHPDDHLDPDEWHRTVVAQADSAWGRDWLACDDDYARAHLARHAAAVGELDRLLLEPLFLLVADPAGLLREFAKVRRPDARSAAAVYEAAVRHVRDADVGEAAAYLALAARQAGVESLADPLARRDLGQRWRARWASWARIGASRIIGRHLGPVGSVVLARLGGRPLVVSGGGDGLLRRWDLETRAALGEPLFGDHVLVRAVAVAELEGRAIALTGGRTGLVGLSDLASGEMLWTAQHIPQVTGVALAAGGIAISAGMDGMIRRWDAASGRPIGEPLECHERGVTALAVGEVDGRVVAVSAGRDRYLRRFDPASGEALARVPIDDDLVRAVAIGEIDNRPVVLASAGFKGAVQIWDIDRGETLGDPLTGHKGFVGALAAGRIGDRPVALSGGRDGTLRLWDLGSREAVAEPMRGHEDSVTAVALAALDGQPVALSGGWDGTVRIWYPAAEQGRAAPSGAASVTALAVTEADGRPVAITGCEDSEIRLWDVATGEPLADPLRGHEHRVSAVAVGTMDARAIAVSGDRDGRICRWDVASAEPLGDPLRTDGVNALALVELDGHQLVVSAGSDGTIRRFDLVTGEELWKPVRAYQSGVTSIAVCPLDGRPVVVAGGGTGAVRAWDVESGRPHTKALRGHEGRVAAIAVTEVAGRPVAVSGGERDGKVRLWDIAAGAALGAHLYAEKRRVRTLAAANVGGRPMLAAGGGWDQGTLRLWDLGTRTQVLEIDVGATITGIAFCRPGLVVATRAGVVALSDIAPRAGAALRLA
jgi:WD40 repeat protein